MGQALFSPSFLESFEKIARQKSNCIRRPEIKWAASDFVDGLLQQSAHVRDAFKRLLSNPWRLRLPTAIFPAALPTELCKSLWIGMEEAEATFDSWCLAGTASLRASPTPGLPLFFCRFVWLKADGGTLRENHSSMTSNFLLQLPYR